MYDHNSSSHYQKWVEQYPPFGMCWKWKNKNGSHFVMACLGKSERKSFEMWGIPRLYVMACSNSVQLVPFQPIASSYRNAIDKRNSSGSNKNMWLSKEERKEEEMFPSTTTLDEFIFYYKNM